MSRCVLARPVPLQPSFAKYLCPSAVAPTLFPAAGSGFVSYFEETGSSLWLLLGFLTKHLSVSQMRVVPDAGAVGTWWWSAVESWTGCGARCGAEALSIEIISPMLLHPKADFSFGCYSKFCVVLEIEIICL